MSPQVLLPGMQHQREARRAAQPARVGGKCVQRSCRRTEQQRVERARVAAGQPVDRVRQGEHQMEIRHRQQLPPPRREPSLLGARLALRAVAVTAGVVLIAQHTATVTALDMPAQRWGAAGDNRTPRLVLYDGQSMRIEIRPTVLAQDVGQTRPVGHDGGATSAARCRATPAATWRRSACFAPDGNSASWSRHDRAPSSAGWCGDPRRIPAGGWRSSGAYADVGIGATPLRFVA